LLYGILEISIDLFGCQCAGGDEQIRTADPLLAKQVLSQLSYVPWDTEYPCSIAAPFLRSPLRGTPPSARGAHTSPREVLQTLRPEEWERQNETMGLFACALEREPSKICDFARTLVETRRIFTAS
jgi:hypothetical protein